ncbi:hypothetical protein ACFTIK_20085, partial [Tistrella mobilis]|uniref:hypothetical protein n=1 Tax=Tistrella mobilis TaxID=171437 RepID=UPI00363BACC3
PTQGRRLGRRLPRKPYRCLKNFHPIPLRGWPQHDLRSVRIGAKPAPDDRLSARQANTLFSLLDGRDITHQDLKSQQKPP